MWLFWHALQQIQRWRRVYKLAHGVRADGPLNSTTQRPPDSIQVNGRCVTNGWGGGYINYINNNYRGYHKIGNMASELIINYKFDSLNFDVLNSLGTTTCIPPKSIVDLE